MYILNDDILRQVKTHLFASAPPAHKEGMQASLYVFNITRLSMMSLVLVLMDLIALIAYSVYYVRTDTVLWAHIVAHLVVVALMAASYLFFTSALKKGHVPTTLPGRNIALVFTAVHFLCEFALFATGPHDISAFVRLCAVPFILGTVPIIKQLHLFLLNALVYILYSWYIFATPLYPVYTPVSSIFANLWVDVFVCTLIISFLLYSAYVNSYVAGVQLQETNEKLDRLSKQDQLTGLNNRRKLVQYLDATWEHALRKGASVTAMMVDIDYFKQFNDYFGHIAGDECLVRVSTTIQSMLAGVPDSVFARYGGEEFVVVLYNGRHDRMVRLAEDVRREVEALRIESPGSTASPYVTVSIGLATDLACSLTAPQKIIEMADEALYRAKRDGRNRVVHHHHETGVFMDAAGRALTQKRAGATLESTYPEEFLRQALLDTSANCYFVYYRDANGIGMLDFSPTAHEVFLLPKSLYNTTWDAIARYVPAGHRKEFLAAVRGHLDAGDTDFALNTYLQNRRNDKKLVMLDVKAVRDPGGSLRFAVGAIASIEDIVQYNRYMQYEAMLNSITLLPNRNKFAKDMARALYEGQTGHVVLLDVKRFKLINSMYSHAIGDKTLLEVGRLLRRLTVNDGQLYSYGLDQFMVTLPNAGEARAVAYMEKVNQYFGIHPVALAGMELHVGFFMAAAAYGPGCANFEETIVNIDIALQKAKRLKGSNYIFFADVDRDEHLANVSLESALADAVQKGCSGFFLQYQPILAAEAARAVGVEALLRWRAPGGDVVSPLVAIPILERMNLMPQVERWIFDRACAQCREWMQSGLPRDFFVQINLSPAQIDRDSLIDELIAAIERNRIPCGNVVVEVTESSLMMDKKKTIDMLKMLRERGVRIAVDDFGTGYSSLSYLRELPVDEIKIDKSFVDDVAEDPKARDFLASVIELSKSMGYTVCVEGIETAGQLAALSGMPIDCFQGFWFARPAPPADIAAGQILQRAAALVPAATGQKRGT